MIISSGKIRLFFLLILFVLAGNGVSGQVKGDSYLKWYSWNATGGFMMPMNLFNAYLRNGIEHTYQFDGVPGYVFSLAKPVGLRLNIGAEMEDQLDKGSLKGYRGMAADTFYNVRTRTYSLYVQYYFSPIINVNPFVTAKVGYGGINRDRRNVDLSRTLPANRWNFFLTAASGVTWHATPNISFNLYGEISALPSRYLLGTFRDLPSLDGRYVYATKVVLTVTGHTDIRVFYPFKRGKVFKTRFKQNNYLPFSRVRVRK